MSLTTLPPIFQVGDVLLSSDILTECFCCDLSACGGACCIEGDSGAPITAAERDELERALPQVWSAMSAAAQTVVDRQGVAYTDSEGDLVTSIVAGRDCVFTCYDDCGTCLCATEKAFREGRTAWCKPISCALYPIRERRLKSGQPALNYHRWSVCAAAVKRGREEGVPLYKFLREPLVRRFGSAWYAELEELVAQLQQAGLL